MKRERRAVKRFWRITGRKKFDTFFEVTIPIGCITDAQLVALLKCLSAKAESSFEDIAGAYVKKRTRRAHNYLEPRSSFPERGYWWQLGDFSFVAAIVDEKGDRVASLRLPRA